MNGNGESTREQIRRESTTDDPAALERRSDTIRQDMGQTLDALQRNYSPGALLDRSMDLFKEHGGEIGTNLGRAVRENPMPVLLTLVGVGWMMMSQSRQKSGPQATGTYDTDDALATGAVSESVRGAKELVMSTVQSGKQRATETSHRAADRAREQSQRAKQGFQTMLEEQPFVVGALGIALGAVIGALIPESEREVRAFGAARERVIERAKELGAKGYEKARETAQEPPLARPGT